MRARHHLACTIWLVFATAATGCTAVTPNLDRQFGSTVNELKAQQVIDPAAAGRSKAVNVDGQTAREAIDRYYKSYKAPTPQPGAFTINAVGAGG